MSYGVYAVTSLDGARGTGCIANSVMQITSEPATIAVSMNHDNFTNQCIAKDGRFAISILSEKSEPTIIGTLGFQSGKDVNKLEGVEHEMVAGLPVLTDTCGYIICEVINQMETSSHTVFLGKVVDAKSYEGAANAMTYAYYHNVVKGKSPKNAPTYIAEEVSEKLAVHKYVCQVCGHEYFGESVPADYKCPICGQGADKFKLAK